jgi:membrane fusion protein, heavy metal efflux system
MTCQPKHSPALMPLRQLSGTLLSLALMATPSAVFAHAGHGDEFHSGEQTAPSTNAIQVDAETADRLELKVEPVARQRLPFGIQTTGQIEALPSRQVQVTYPVNGTVVQLFVQPGDSVEVGQPLAVITSGELAELRVDALDRQAETLGALQEAEANLRLAQQNYEQQQQIAQTAINQAQTEVRVAQEQYDRDQELTEQGAIGRREFLESEGRLAEAQEALAEAESRLGVLEARNQLERAQTALEVAQNRAELSTATYSTRLKQLGADANPDGTITITAPIAGRVADREVTLGQSAEDAGTPLMTIVDDRTVLATANVYEKDLNQVKTGQAVRVTVAGLPDRAFQGRITVVGAVVDGETRVAPVKAELDNADGALKPGMFAELEVITDRTTEAVLAIPQSAIVDANGQSLVFVQNGNSFQPVEVTLGRTAGDQVEVASGLFDGDRIVTQRANQLYAQSLRGGTAKPEVAEVTEANVTGGALPWWMLALGGSAIAVSTFAAGTWWAGRRRPTPSLAVNHSGYNGSTHHNLDANGVGHTADYKHSDSSTPALVKEPVDNETPHHPH